MDYAAIFNTIMASLSTILVAYLGYRQNRKTKEDEEYRRLREQYDEERAEAIKKEKEEEEKRLKKIESNIQDLHDDVEKLHETMNDIVKLDLEEITKQLKNLHTMQTNNFSYIGSLSNVVVNIGESLARSDVLNDTTNDHLSEIIEEHRKIETDIHTQLYKMIL